MTARKKAIIFIILIAVIGIFIYIAMTNVKNQQSDSVIPKNAYPVNLETPHRERIVTKVTAKGIVGLDHKSTLFCSSTAEIVNVSVKAGDTVKKGQTLIEYSDKGLDTLKNSLEDARLALKTAQLSLQSLQIPPAAAELRQSELQIKQYEKSIQDIQSQIDQLDLTIEQLKRNIETAEKKYGDTKLLYENGVIAKAELDAAHDAIKKLEDQLETYNAQKLTALLGVPMAQENLDFAREQYNTLLNRGDDPKLQIQISQQKLNIEQIELNITRLEKQINDFMYEELSPADGIVTNLYIAEGEMGTVGRQLAEIADTSDANLVIRADVPENDAGNLMVGQDVEITGDAFGKTVFNGKLTKINPLAEKKQIGNSIETVLSVEVSITDANGRFRPGYSVETSIITKISENALVVPLMSTLTDTDGSSYLYVMHPDFTVEKRLITLGQYFGLYIQADGVTEDDKVILNPAPQIKEGVYVKPILKIGE